MRQAHPDISQRRACATLPVPRAALHPRPSREARPLHEAASWSAPVPERIEQDPTFGYRRLGALLRGRTGLLVNRKAIYRLLKQRSWLVHQRPRTPRPRARGLVSQARRSNERWAIEVTPSSCGVDGWAHLAAVLDGHDREVIG